MRLLRQTVLACLLAGAPVAVAPLAAQDFGPRPDSATRAEILVLREKAWRTFFANDQAGFMAVVPAELLAMGWDGGPWQDRARILESMAEFARSGLRLESLEFPENVMQRYGDAVILYTRFRLVLRAADGTTSETRGRGTEMFVRRDGRWIHTGWHLDTVPQ
jgi:hypothetical protein